MRSHCICERTAQSADLQLSIFLAHFSESAESGENFCGGIDALSQVSRQLTLFPSEALADIAEQQLEIFRRHALAERIDEPREDWQVGFGESALCRFSQLEENGGTPPTRPHRALSHDAIPLEHSEMRSHRVVRDPECRAQLLYSPMSATELRHDLASGSREKPVILRHRTSGISSI
jgi:hypothetical protein